MTAQSRPDLQVRIIGPAATVQTCLHHILCDLRILLGTTSHYRINTTLARHPGEIRTYITVRRREAPR